jgi:hypothetical protein
MHDAAWEAQLARLASYKAVHGDCNVPRDLRLASWVDTQRRFKRQLEASEASPRVRAKWAQLAALGFVWNHPDPDLD